MGPAYRVYHPEFDGGLILSLMLPVLRELAVPVGLVELAG